jgi:hypothetical protein
MARFIVGSTMKIQPVATWNASGVLRTARKLPQNATVIALDPIDALKFGISKGQEGLYLLYDNLPIEEPQRGAISFNPSILPFLSQRLLIVLCKLSPDNYSFYQRRVAEFQSRLESAVEVGRSLVQDTHILDLSSSVSPWVRSSMPNAVRPPDELWSAWSSGNRISDLELAAKEAEKRNWWILLDAWTPAPIRTRVSGLPMSILIGPPEADYDFFAYLHNIYLQIWSRAVEK